MSNFLQSLLNRQVRVTISDDRAVHGRLTCIDHLGNLIVENAAVIDNADGEHSLASVMVPGKHIVKLEISGD
jgi:small nuclear ribonucleoprotein (snRNP)-like protein